METVKELFLTLIVSTIVYSLISAFIYDPLDDDPGRKDRKTPTIALEINSLPPMHYYKMNEGNS
jgi:hypothetical protein